MTIFTDDEIDLFAQALFAGFHSDAARVTAREGQARWETESPLAKGNWRRAARALIRHLYHGQPVNKAPHHMSEEETEVVRLCDEYEEIRKRAGTLFEAKTSLIAHTLAEHFELIRRAVHTAPVG